MKSISSIAKERNVPLLQMKGAGLSNGALGMKLEIVAITKDGSTALVDINQARPVRTSKKVGHTEVRQTKIGRLVVDTSMDIFA